MKSKIKLSKFELQSGLNRVRYAENLILQLPDTYEGRNTWLINYGISKEAKKLRKKRNIKFIKKTQSAKTIKS